MRVAMTVAMFVLQLQLNHRETGAPVGDLISDEFLEFARFNATYLLRISDHGISAVLSVRD